MADSILLASVALVLFFFLPGYLLSRALWPEWRLRGEKALELGVLTVTSALVFSTALTVLAGFYLGNVGLFQAGPGNPLLEEVLAALSALLLVIGWWRGAFSKDPPPAPSYARAPLAGEEDVEEYMQEMASLAQEERRLLHAIRTTGRTNPGKRERLESELETLRTRRRAKEADREERMSS
jgi:uncharacterized membrane protein